MERRILVLNTANQTPLSDDFSSEIDHQIGEILEEVSRDPADGSHLGSPNDYYTYLPQPGHKTTWTKSLKEDSVAKTEAYTELQFDDLSLDVHTSLDALPHPGTYLLDILWLCDTPPVEFPALLYGALRRGVCWHGAVITVITENDSGPLLPGWLTSLRAEVIPLSMMCSCHSLAEYISPRLAWRGSLAFYCQDELNCLKMPGFELHIDLHSQNFKDNKTKRSAVYVSSSLEVVSEVDLDSVPPHILTGEKLVLKSPLLGEDDLIEEYFDESFSKPNQAVIMKLKYAESKPRVDCSKLTTENWKLEVFNSNLNPSSLCDTIGDDVSEVILLVFDDPEAEENCTRVAIQKIAVVLKNLRDIESANTLKEMQTGSLKSDVEKIDEASAILGGLKKIQVDDKKSEIVKTFVRNVQKAVFDMLIDNRSELLAKYSEEDIMDAIQYKVIGDIQIKDDTITVEENIISRQDILEVRNRVEKTEFDQDLVINPDEIEEKRFLSFLQKHHEQSEKEKRTSNPHKVPEDYVLLEAKELLKFFDKNGLHVKTDNLQPLSPKQRDCPLRPQKSKEEYEEFFSENFEQVCDDFAGFAFKGKDFPKVEFTQYHDVYYNTGDKAEMYDREGKRLHGIHVGLARETASTFVQSHETDRLPVGPRTTAVVVGGGTGTSGGKEGGKVATRKSPRKKVAVGRENRPNAKSPAATISAQKSRPQDKRQKQLESRKGKPVPGGERAKKEPLVEKAKNTTSGDFENHVQKSKPEPVADLNKNLRVSVYAALKQEGIGENDSLYKPCYRKLYNICRMYVQDMPDKKACKKDWMFEVAEINVKNVIAMEKMTRKR